MTAASENLGLLLVSAEYYNRIQKRLEQQDKEIAHLQRAMRDLRFTIGDLHDTMRQVLMHTHAINLKVDHVEATAKALLPHCGPRGQEDAETLSSVTDRPPSLSRPWCVFTMGRGGSIRS